MLYTIWIKYKNNNTITIQGKTYWEIAIKETNHKGYKLGREIHRNNMIKYQMSVSLIQCYLNQQPYLKQRLKLKYYANDELERK